MRKIILVFAIVINNAFTADSELKPACSVSFEDFCHELYSPKNLGNLDISITKNEQLKLRFGVSKNNFSSSFNEFEKAKLANQKDLPGPFYKRLKTRGYFSKLKKLLTSGRNRRLGNELALIWSDSIRETLDEKMLKKYPNYFSKFIEDRVPYYYPDDIIHGIHSLGNSLPLAWDIEYGHLKNELLSDIYKNIWTKSQSWKKVGQNYKDVKLAYQEMLTSNNHFTKISPQIKALLLEKIQNEELVAPSSDPYLLDIGCASSDENAFHWNAGGITVCSGFIATLPLTNILAHELSHSLGEYRNELLFENNSELKKRIIILASELKSSRNKTNCPNEWPKIKNEYQNLLKYFDNYSPLLPDLYMCVQTKVIKDIPTLDYLKQRASARSKYKISRIADLGHFIQLSKPIILTNDGLEWPNPTFLDPTSFSNWKEEFYTLKDNFTLDFFFSAEYACSDPSLPATKRLEHSINTTKNMYSELLEKLIPLGGKFSRDIDMTGRDLAEDSEERFADAMANEVTAYMLSKEPNLEKRRKIYFAWHSSACKPISLSDKFDAEFQVQNKFSLEPHATGKQRRYDFLTKSIRDVLDCKLDFIPKDCM
jgi:hypothetical protein